MTPPPLVAFLALLVGCSPSQTPATDSLPPVVEAESISFDQPPKAVDEIECTELVTEREAAAILEEDEVTVLGRIHSECHWVTARDVVQLVFHTGRNYSRWRDLLLDTYTHEIEVTDAVELRRRPGERSYAAFGPDRGLLLHGSVSEERAVRLLLLALSRL